MRRLTNLAFLTLLFASAPLRADHIQLSGNMDATMKLGETATFTVQIAFKTSGFSGPLSVVIDASPELTLEKTTIQSFNCTETPSINTCRGNPTFKVGDTVTITQILTVRPDFTSQIGKGSWRIQLVGDGLSGVDPRVGFITIPDAGPRIIMTVPPKGMMRSEADKDPATDSVSFKNVGNSVGRISLLSTDNFRLGNRDFLLVQDLGVEEAITVKIIENQALRPLGETGFFTGALTVRGEGVDPSVQAIPLRLVVTKRPAATPKPEPEKPLTTISASPGDPNPKGSVKITNSGPGELTGLASSDAPWLDPDDVLFSLKAGETKPLQFTIDLKKQAQVLAETGGVGSLTGTLSIDYLLPAAGSPGRISTLDSTTPASTTSITVISVLKASAAAATIPPLPDLHGQLFLSGLGRAGQLFSDFAIYPQVLRDNAVSRFRSLIDVDLYYTPIGGGTSKKASIPSLSVPGIASFADVVGSVYGTTEQVGSMQIRVPGFLADGGVGTAANAFTVTKAGTTGTSIPVFNVNKFACSQDLTKKLYIPGVRKDASASTSFFVQETCGSNAKVAIDFLDASGSKIGSKTVDVPAFAAMQVAEDAAPAAAASSVLSHASGSAGGFVAYATTTDRASGDTSAQLDWVKFRNFLYTDPVVIPVVGSTTGLNGTMFRSDVTLMNTGSAAASGTLRFYNRNGTVADKPVNLGSMQTVTYSDVTTTLFGVAAPNAGYLLFTPAAGSNFALTSRNYSTVAGSSVGAAVPILPLSAAMFPTAVRRIGAVEDYAPRAVAAQRPASFRSNIGLIETTGQAARVRVTAYYRYTSSLTSAMNAKSVTLDLAPRQFLLAAFRHILFGGESDTSGDLHNVVLEFEVIGSTGRVVPFVSTIDNATGDSTLRFN